MTGSSWPTYRTIDGLKVTYTRLWEESGGQREGTGWWDGLRGLGGTRHAETKMMLIPFVQL